MKKLTVQVPIKLSEDAKVQIYAEYEMHKQAGIEHLQIYRAIQSNHRNPKTGRLMSKAMIQRIVKEIEKKKAITYGLTVSEVIENNKRALKAFRDTSISILDIGKARK